MFHGQVHDNNKKLLYETENKNNLVVYERKKELQCSVCNKVFGRKSDLKRHFSTVHEGKRPFECSFCPAKFCKRMDMNHHITIVHEERTFLPHRPVQFHFMFSSFLACLFKIVFVYFVKGGMFLSLKEVLIMVELLFFHSTS